MGYSLRYHTCRTHKELQRPETGNTWVCWCLCKIRKQAVAEICNCVNDNSITRTPASICSPWFDTDSWGSFLTLPTPVTTKANPTNMFLLPDRQGVSKVSSFLLICLCSQRHARTENVSLPANFAGDFALYNEDSPLLTGCLFFAVAVCFLSKLDSLSAILQPWSKHHGTVMKLKRENALC